MRVKVIFDEHGDWQSLEREPEGSIWVGLLFGAMWLCVIIALVMMF